MKSHTKTVVERMGHLEVIISPLVTDADQMEIHRALVVIRDFFGAQLETEAFGGGGMTAYPEAYREAAARELGADQSGMTP
jgi:hypothetical protein